jgi:hypothetical protein
MTRELQLGFFHNDCCIKQDQELIDLIQQHKFVRAIAKGSVNYFNQFVEFVEDQPVDFCIFIINEPFDFDILCQEVNTVIQQHMNANGLIYLSVNKYLVDPRCYSDQLDEDYDQAIKQFVERRVNAAIKTYWPCGNDHGNKFNWLHPLTRFLLQVNK